GKDARAFASTKICAIGSVTAEVLKGNGIIADLIPYPYTTASIARALSDIGIAGNRILLPRAEDAPRALVDALTDAGAEVDEVPAYRVVTNRELSQDEIQIALHAHIDIVCFTSPSTVNAFFEVIGSERAQRVLQSCRIACIGPVTANAIRKRGLIPHIIADEHTSEGLVQAIVQDASTH
ncbi:MAG TPA: uroporphyrinogen-III synthase, partial [Armatimonadetes bacterium]|nr:uroporphyrinogen-III synthase [Armatimonadota bacterium]